MSVGFTGEPDSVLAAIAEAQAAIDSIQGKTVHITLTRMQRLHLLALGYIDIKGNMLVEMDLIWEALKRYRDKR